MYKAWKSTYQFSDYRILILSKNTAVNPSKCNTSLYLIYKTEELSRPGFDKYLLLPGMCFLQAS
jgi:hypothetical protein